MKKVLVMSVALLLIATAAQAQGFKFTLYGGGGVSLPMTPDYFKDAYKMGTQFGGGAGIQIGSMLEIGARVYLYSHNPDEEGALEHMWHEAGGTGEPPSGLTLTVDGADLTMTQITGDIKLLLGPSESRVRAYLVGSFGTGKAKIKAATVTLRAQGIPNVNDTTITQQAVEDEDDGTTFGGGVGMDIMFSPMIGMFIEGKYMIVKAEEDDWGYIPVRAGIRIAIVSDK